MSQQDLVDRINRLGISEGKVSIQNVNNMLNNPNEIRPVLVKKIEIALNMPKDSLMALLPEYTYSTMQERVDRIERRRKTNKRNRQGTKREEKDKRRTNTRAIRKHNVVIR